MSTAQNRHLHIPPGKVEIEGRNGCAFNDEEEKRAAEAEFAALKVEALLIEVSELQTLLGKKEAENKHMEVEKYTLEASNKKIESSKNKLEAYAKRKLATYKAADWKKQAQINITQAQNAELKIILDEKTAQIKQVVQEKDILEAENKKIRREKKEFEVFTKKKLAVTKEKYSKALQERNDKLKQSQIKLDAAYAEISMLQSLLAQKETENKQINNENDMLEAKYQKSKSDKKELEALAKKKLATTKHKYQKVLQERNVMLKQKQDKIDAMNRHNRR